MKNYSLWKSFEYPVSYSCGNLENFNKLTGALVKNGLFLKKVNVCLVRIVLLVSRKSRRFTFEGV